MFQFIIFFLIIFIIILFVIDYNIKNKIISYVPHIKHHIKIKETSNFLQKLSHVYHILNTNVPKLEDTIHRHDFKEIVQSFINPYTKKTITQNENSYYYICNVPEKQSNKKYLYNWNHPNWEGVKIKHIEDEKHKHLLDNIKNRKSLNLFFNNSTSICIYEWKNKLKICINRTFINHDKLYILGTGFNFERAPHEKYFYNMIRNYSKYLQNIICRFNGVHKSGIVNFDNANNFLHSISHKYPLSKIKVYIPDYHNFKNTETYILDYSTLRKISDKKKINPSKISIIKNIYDTYSVGNNNKKIFSDGDSGIIPFIVNNIHYLSIFYVTYKNDVQEIISVEININENY
jgi:hypothetical protein